MPGGVAAVVFERFLVKFSPYRFVHKFKRAWSVILPFGRPGLAVSGFSCIEHQTVDGWSGLWVYDKSEDFRVDGTHPDYSEQGFMAGLPSSPGAAYGFSPAVAFKVFLESYV